VDGTAENFMMTSASNPINPAAIQAFEARGIEPETVARLGIYIGERKTMPNQSIFRDEVVSRLSFDPETGEFTWRERPIRGFWDVAWNRLFAGKRAGTPDRFGYLRIGLGGGVFSAARMAWLVGRGDWPDGEIDHINRVKSDNRLANLRCVRRSENLMNRSHAKSGAKGVYQERGKWTARIRINGKTKYLGRFDTKEAAADKYKSAESQRVSP
jgi:hypothetical protein